MNFNHEKGWIFYEPEPTPEAKRHRLAMVQADGIVQGNIKRLENIPLDTAPAMSDIYRHTNGWRK